VTLLEPGHELHAPDFLLIEMDNVLCTWLRGRGIDHAKADIIRTALRAAPVDIHPSLPLLDPAYRIATDTGISVYDALYVALAELLGGKLVTADAKLKRSLARSPFAKTVVWIEHLA
jgi:predicted nucleic acid-binding protein